MSGRLHRWRLIYEAGLQQGFWLINDNLQLDTAAYAVTRLRAAGIDACRNPHSLTVVFPRPPQAIFDKWTIAPHRKIGHLITMPHVTREIVDSWRSTASAISRSTIGRMATSP